MKKIDPTINYPNLENFDRSVPAQTEDSCTTGCLNRGHMYEIMHPLLKTTKTQTLAKDDQTQFFDTQSRHNFVKPLLNRLNRYQSVSGDSLDFTNLRLGVDNLIQARLDRKENTEQREKENIESIWNYVIGSLFLLIILIKIGKLVYDYFTHEYKEKKEKRQEVKQEKEAVNLIRNLRNISMNQDYK